MSSSFAAAIYAAVTAVVIVFQLGLAAGKPWGKLAMGGKFPGRFPTKMRVGAVIQAAILGCLAVVVLVKAGMILPGWLSVADKLIWVVVGCAAIGLVLNVITPSKWERILWAPATAVLLVASVVVAVS